jgi:hypothetical protein
MLFSTFFRVLLIRSDIISIITVIIVIDLSILFSLSFFSFEFLYSKSIFN